jgi:hypothetical protein
MREAFAVPSGDGSQKQAKRLKMQSLVDGFGNPACLLRVRKACPS